MAHIEPVNSLLTNPKKLLVKKELERGLIENLIIKVNEQTKFPLNDSQEDAFKETFETPLTLIWGPPGTGKTDTLSKIIIGWLERNDLEYVNILIGSNNYNAIDNLLKKLLEQYESNKMKLYRVRSAGRERISNEEVIDIDATNKNDRKNISQELTQSNQNNIVASTWKQIINVSKKQSKKINQRWFDLIIIDEASQVPVSNSMGYFLLAKENCHFILAGDPKQLGPIYSYKVEEENFLYDCIFTYYTERFNVQPKALNTTYRSNAPITLWPSERFYDSNYFSFKPKQCLNHIFKVPKEKPTSWPADLFWDPLLYTLCDPNHPISILVHDEKVSTLANYFESDIIASLTYIYKEIYKDSSDIFWNKRIGIVTPHRAQVSTIRNKISHTCNFDDDCIAVNSVDKFQGDEREIILSSYSVSDKDFIQSEEEFILNSRRFNVTLTRAKSKFILVISKSLVEYISGDLSIAEDASHLQMFITKYSDYLSSYEINYNNQGQEMKINCDILSKIF